MQQADANHAQQILGYDFQDLARLEEALQAPGSSNTVAGRILPEGNKRLALVGLSVLTMSVNQACYEIGSSRGQTSTELQFRTSTARLAELTRLSTLDMCIAINPSQDGHNVPPLLLSDTIKAVLGAVWLDSACDIHAWDAAARALQAVG